VKLVHSLQNVEVLRHMAAERQAQLRAATVRVASATAPRVRQRIGRRIVKLGAWVAREPAGAGTPAR
jgi:hypothetical protein